MSEVAPSGDASNDAAPSKSLKIAYLLLVTLGLLGVHRFYLERWLSGIAFLLVFMAALIDVEGVIMGGLLIGVIVDAFFVPGLVRKANQHLEKEFEEHPEHFEIVESDEIAPWAQRQTSGFFDVIRAPGRVIQYLSLCALFTMLMVYLENDEFILFLVVILLTAGLITSLDQILVRYPAVKNFPGIEDAVDRVVEMREYYWHNEPKLGGSILGMFSRAKTEYKPYWKIVGLMALAIILDSFFSFGADYAPHLTPADAAVVLIVHFVFAVTAVLLVLSPVSALSFHYSLSGKRVRLRILTVIALVMIGVTFAASREVIREPGHVSLLSTLRLDLRIENEAFQAALDESASMYLFYSYYRPDFPNPQSEGMQCTLDRLPGDPCGPTLKLREVLKGVAPNSEGQAFEVFDTSYDSVAKEGTLLRAVRYAVPDEPYMIVAVIDEFGGMCSRWAPDEPPEWYSEEEEMQFFESKVICDDLIESLESDMGVMTDLSEEY